MSNNRLLNNKIDEILLIINQYDGMTPITSEELLQIIKGEKNGG